MLTKQMILSLLKKLNQDLKEHDIKGEIVIVGGAAMCLAFNARAATKDIDCLMKPTAAIREAAQRIAESEEVPSDWINDGVKGFFSNNIASYSNEFSMSHLSILIPPPEYILAMKCLSARFDTKDSEDVAFLIHHLKLSDKDQVFSIIENYYPKKVIPAKTTYFIEELIENSSKNKPTGPT